VKDIEVWKSVPECEGRGMDFEASSWGRVRLVRKKRGQYVRGGTPRTGSKYKSGNSFRFQLNTKLAGAFLVARLVCAAFKGPCPPGLNCLHIDENGANNRPENLKWGTQKENLNAPGFIADRQKRMCNQALWATHWKKDI